MAKVDPKKNFLFKYHQQIACIFVALSSLAAIFGVILTFVSMGNSANALKSQLQEQKKATSVLVVSDFLTEVGSGILNKKRKDPDFQRLVVTRTKLLLESLDFPDLTAQIIKFLGTNEFGDLFDRDKNTNNTTQEGTLSEQNNYIFLKQVSLEDGDFTNITLKNADMNCIDLRNAKLAGVSLDNINIIETDLRQAIITGGSLKGATISRSNLEGATLMTELEGTKILFSNLRRITPYKNPTEPRDTYLERVAETLSKVKSLYGSILDPDLEKKLAQKLHNKEKNLDYLLYDIRSFIREENITESLTHLQRTEARKLRTSWSKNWEEIHNTCFPPTGTKALDS